jgi:hypothetical protein
VLLLITPPVALRSAFHPFPQALVARICKHHRIVLSSSERFSKIVLLVYLASKFVCCRSLQMAAASSGDFIDDADLDRPMRQQAQFEFTDRLCFFCHCMRVTCSTVSLMRSFRHLPQLQDFWCRMLRETEGSAAATAALSNVERFPQEPIRRLMRASRSTPSRTHLCHLPHSCAAIATCIWSW